MEKSFNFALFFTDIENNIYFNSELKELHLYDELNNNRYKQTRHGS